MAVEPDKDYSLLCCKTINIKKRYLKLICGVLFVLLFSLLMAMIIIVIKLYSTHPMCVTQTCLQTATTTLSYINPAVDPCDNFYDFACGNYIKQAVIPEDEVSVEVFLASFNVLESQLKSIITEPLPQNCSRPYNMAKQLYNTCMDTDRIELNGLEKIRQILKGLGGWPLLEGNKWNEASFDWIQTLIKLRQSGLDYTHFIEVQVQPNDKNSSHYVLTLDQKLILIGSCLKMKFCPTIVSAYQAFITEIAVVFGADKKQVISEAKSIVQFESDLSNICVLPENLRNSSILYNPTSINNLQENFPDINWLKFLTGMVNMPHIKITGEDIVIVRIPSYLANLLLLIKETPKRVMANYLLAKTVISMVPYLTQALKEKELNYQKVFKGVLHRKPRWKECVEVVLDKINLPISSLYIKKHFKDEYRNQAEDLARTIKNEFISTLKKVSWLDDTTRRNALEKAAAIALHIGYPSELVDDEKLNEYYSKAVINFDSYLSAILSFNLFNDNIEFGRLHRAVNKTDWRDHSTVTDINAYYSPDENSISFPAAFLQGAIFDINRPNYMNYGVLGYVIGHEITHGFDDQGRQYDKVGNLNEWWTKNTSDTFKEKAECFVRQYDNYIYPELNAKINGIATQGENIADNGGIKMSYLAYRRWVKKNGVEAKLPGLDYTPNQMFWISSAQLWCGKFRREEMTNMILTDCHAPPRFRVIGPLSNSEYFLKDFKCAPNSAMNAKTKCVIW